ncbi:hypothetical protein M433DRAFT_512082 [Acidomyces richmondensis BFW]|nr:hypothetical protein M433DRAFT_512082 [Acidomyces richmondensis BFW]
MRKTVRFADEPSNKIYFRKLTNAEAWTLYDFEKHARTCRHCYHPWDVHMKRRFLCPSGSTLAERVIEQFQQIGDYAYSLKLINGKFVQVDWPVDYVQTAQMLKYSHALLLRPWRTNSAGQARRI